MQILNSSSELDGDLCILSPGRCPQPFAGPRTMGDHKESQTLLILTHILNFGDSAERVRYTFGCLGTELTSTSTSCKFFLKHLFRVSIASVTVMDKADVSKIFYRTETGMPYFFHESLISALNWHLQYIFSYFSAQTRTCFWRDCNGQQRHII